jgi:serine/threonine-protein kinase
MSPEQATGERHVDSRTDIYSLGAVLYELLAGDPPHTGPTMQAVLAKILTETPRPITQIRRSVPPHVNAVLERALSRIPADRFATAQQMIDALARPDATVLLPAAAQADHGATLLVTRLQRFAKLVLIPVGAALGAFFLGQNWRGAATAETARFTIPTSEPQLDQSLGLLPLVRLSPDNRSFVFSQEGRLSVRRLDRFDAVPLAGSEAATTPAFSPDGRWLVFGQNGKLRKMSVDGGPVADIVGANYRYGAQWAADGNIYFSAGLGDRGIWRVSAAGGDPVPVTSISETSGENAHGWPQLLPGGHDLLFTEIGNSGGTEDSRVVIESLKDHKRTVLINNAVYGRYINSGHILYSGRNGAVFALPFSVSRRAVSGIPIPVLESATVAVWGGAALFDVSDAGTLIYVPGSSTEQHVMRLVDRRGQELRQVGAPHNIRGAMLSPDGRKIAVTLREPSKNDIWILNSSDGSAERFTLEPVEEEMPVWSSDGTAIAYTGANGQSRRILSKETSAGTEPKLVRLWHRHLHLTSWSREGNWLAAYDYHPINNEDVWLISAMGRDSVPVATTAAREVDGVFSPDGRWLAYQSDESGRFEVYVVAVPGLNVKRQVSTGGGTVPRWDASGRSLYFLSADHRIMSVAVSSGTGFELRGTPAPLFATPAYDYSVTPDGSGFLVSMLNPNVSTPAVHVVINWFDDLRRLSDVSPGK